MAQHDYDIANGTGAAVRADLNNVLGAIASNNGGATAPSTTFANMWWYDETNNILKKRDEANTSWHSVASFDDAGGTFRWLGEIGITQMTALTAPDTADELALYDASATAPRKITIGDFFKSIDTITAETAPATGDEVVLFDASAAAARKMTLANALTVVNALTEDATPDSASDYILTYDASAVAAKKVKLSTIAAGAPRGYIAGLALSNNGTDATNDIDIAVGVARDNTNAQDIVLASALTKRLDAAWAVGTNQGGLDTGSIANGTYHVWLIKRSDTGVVDALFSTSASSPTMPTNYDYKRRIGSILRESAAIVGFVQDGDDFYRKSAILDVNANNPGTSAVTRTLSVPTGIRVKAITHASLAIAAAGGGASWYLSDLSLTDVAASLTVAPLGTVLSQGGATAESQSVPVAIWTNTSGQIRSRLSFSTTDHTVYIATLGWLDRRGRDA